MHHLWEQVEEDDNSAIDARASVTSQEIVRRRADVSNAKYVLIDSLMETGRCRIRI